MARAVSDCKPYRGPVVVGGGEPGAGATPGAMVPGAGVGVVPGAVRGVVPRGRVVDGVVAPEFGDIGAPAVVEPLGLPVVVPGEGDAPVPADGVPVICAPAAPAIIIAATPAARTLRIATLLRSPLLP